MKRSPAATPFTSQRKRYRLSSNAGLAGCCRSLFDLTLDFLAITLQRFRHKR